MNNDPVEYILSANIHRRQRGRGGAKSEIDACPEPRGYSNFRIHKMGSGEVGFEMARPRTPAKILELRGAFKANPQRRREDADRATAAQEVLRADGMTTTDVRGSVKAHPLLSVEAAAWAAIRSAFRQLNLATDPTPARIGRPATRR